MEPDEIEKLELPGPHFQGSVSNVRKHFPRVEKPYAASPGSHSSQTGLTRKRTRELGMLDTTPQQSKRKSPRKAFPDNVEFIHIEEDDPDPVATIEQQYQTICRTRPKSNDASAATIDLTANDYLTDNQCDQLLRKMSLQEDKEKAAALDIREPIPSYTNNKPRFKCTPGKCVELFDGDFLRIKSALQDGHGKVFVRGDHLVRQNYRGLTMSKRRNEVVLVRRVVESTAGTNSALHEVSVEHVLKNRHIIFTNQNFPLLSGRDDDASFQDPTQQVTFGPLFCRWIDTTVVDERRRSVEHIIQRLDFRDADDDTRSVDGDRTRKTRIATNEARFQWRGIPTELGGMHVSGRRTGHLDGKIEVEQVRSYTFADAFCGAGGTSRGAIDAGLHLRWGFDNNLEAITSYRHNFQRHGADCRHQSVDEFIRLVIALNDVSPFRVDVLHISPPCQPFSPAHTIPSPERDEMNQAALPSVWQLVEKLKPRIVTMEETEGLFTRHKEWFSLLINTFTSLGYSVRWKIVQCHSFGVPQTRRRLVIIAAGPGEKLPPFPAPTHSADDPTLKPLATINSAISGIPANAPNHDMSVRFEGGARAPLDGDTQAKTITTNAGQGNYHPSGKRPYTLRELASLQTFPLYHSFAGARGVTEMKRQIGNAVPPLLSKAFFRSVKKSLKESDGV